ncbi:MAG: DNA-binding response regulator [Spirulinaceae cyanobacterium SM2_1_0]|nr:DNA-binding response regulator [Spirulinaceae cyanobacterium SM2_1_0]
MSREFESQVLKLYAQNMLPRQIALRLGLRVADVHAVLCSREPIRDRNGTPTPLASCLTNVNCARYLLSGMQPQPGQILSCLGMVLVARCSGPDDFLVCTYLIDYLCLGIKDTLGPRLMTRPDYEHFISHTFASFPDGYQVIEFAAAQAMVLGAANYALQLGFQPCREFAETRSHLGHWSGEPQLQFGYQGKPFYINGPYDNPRQVLRTLEKNVGHGNFDYILGVG